MIAFEGQLQEDEYRRAQWLSSPLIIKWIGWIVLAGLVMVLLTGGLQPILADPVISGIRLAAAIAFAGFMIIAPRRAITKVWERTPLSA